MGLTRRDYEMIAGTIRVTMDRAAAREHPVESVRRELAGRLARRFEADNQRFDAQRFVDACGVPRHEEVTVVRDVDLEDVERQRRR